MGQRGHRSVLGIPDRSYHRDVLSGVFSDASGGVSELKHRVASFSFGKANGAPVVFARPCRSLDRVYLSSLGFEGEGRRRDSSSQRRRGMNSMPPRLAGASFSARFNARERVSLCSTNGCVLNSVSTGFGFGSTNAQYRSRLGSGRAMDCQARRR
jgi:hypothetical protein